MRTIMLKLHPDDVDRLDTLASNAGFRDDAQMCRSKAIVFLLDKYEELTGGLE